MSKEIRDMINRVKNFKQYVNENENNTNIMKKYVLKGVAEYLNAYSGLGGNIKKLIKYDDIPFNLLKKTEQYREFEKSTLKKYTKKGYIDNVPIGNKLKNYSPVFSDYYKYYFYGVFGMISIFGVDEVKKRIPYYNNLISFLNELPELTGDYENGLLLYDSFNNKMKDKSAPLKEVGLLLGTRFRDEYINLQKINDRELYS